MRRTASRGGSSGTRRGSRSRRNSQAFGSSPTRRELPSTFSLRSGVSATAPSSRQLLRQKRIRIDPVSRPGAPTNTRRVCRGTLCRSRATSDATRLLVEKRTLSLPKISRSQVHIESSKQVFDDQTMDIGQTEIAPGVPIRQAFVIEAQQVQKRRM
jgi:hypothetical protein